MHEKNCICLYGDQPIPGFCNALKLVFFNDGTQEQSGGNKVVRGSIYFRYLRENIIYVTL